ncbi:RxLR effector protein, partial [Phytophthora megakarya]
IQTFGELYGLHVQPAESVFISLNTAIDNKETIQGIPILKHGQTTRYLGHQVGTGKMEDVNWEDRIRKIQRRLATACMVSTTVEDRVEILNVAVLSAEMFTATAFQLPKWAEKKLLSLQKTFL